MIDGVDPVVVERRPIDGGGFVIVSTGSYTTILDPDDARSIVIDGVGIEPGYEYRVQAKDQLRMADVDGPVEWNVAYRGTILAPQCAGDLDGNNVVNLIDLLTILSDWGQINHPSDLDQDGSVELGDLLIVLSHWGPCPG